MDTDKSIEDLSDELFYEIFDYLDSCSILHAFCNLNQHFQRLIHSSLLLFKVQHSWKDYFTFIWSKIITDHRQQIVYLQFGELFFTDHQYLSLPFILNSSFTRLKALSMYFQTSHRFIAALENFISLPDLEHLRLCVGDVPIDLRQVYQILFKLSKLKCLSLSVSRNHQPLLELPTATNASQLSSIQCLRLTYDSSFDHILEIVSYTPKLQSLAFLHDTNLPLSETKYSPEIFPNLTSLSIGMYDGHFISIFRFVTEIKINFKTLHITTESESFQCLRADRWEQLISEYFPQLEKFSCYHYEYLNNDTPLSTYPSKIDGFNSKFWIEKKWLMECEIHEDRNIYRIQPYKYIMQTTLFLFIR